MIPREQFVESVDQNEANWRLHLYAVEHNREVRRRQWEHWSVSQRRAALANGWTAEAGWRNAIQ